VRPGSPAALICFGIFETQSTHALQLATHD
jgi:hypothetical protein